MSPPVDQKSFETAAPATGSEYESSFTSVGRRDHSWKRAQVVLRAIALLFSIISFVLLATDSQVIVTPNDLILVESFNVFIGYRYLLAIGVISTFYTIVQILRHIIEFQTGKYMLSHQRLIILDYFGDLILAFLLISAASVATITVIIYSAIPALSPTAFTASTAASIASALLAFIILGLSASIPAFKLSKTNI